MRKHCDGVAERVVGQIGQNVARLTKSDQLRTEPPYGVPAPTGRPGAGGKAAQPAYELIELSGWLRHDATLTSASGANGACPSGRAEAG